MATPTIESRRRRRVLIQSADAQAVKAMRALLPEDWEWLDHLDCKELGSFEDVLQLRFIVIDLAPATTWDPIGNITHVRAELALNVPILCFGGLREQRDRARMAGADRLFEFDELLAELPELFGQFGW